MLARCHQDADHRHLAFQQQLQLSLKLTEPLLDFCSHGLVRDPMLRRQQVCVDHYIGPNIHDVNGCVPLSLGPTDSFEPEMSVAHELSCK